MAPSSQAHTPDKGIPGHFFRIDTSSMLDSLIIHNSLIANRRAYGPTAPPGIVPRINAEGDQQRAQFFS